MSRPITLRAYLRVPFLLAAIASCQDPTDPRVGMQERPAQGSLATWTVNTLGDPGDGVCEETGCTLREAIAAAASGDKIVFGGSLQGDIKLEAGQLSIDKSLTIDGAGRIAVDAQRNSRVISVAALSGPDVKLAGLTFKNGLADRGAGIAVGISTLTLDRVTVSGNEATIDGGGISVGLGTVNILNSAIASNTAAEKGGGIHVSGGGELTLDNSTVESNTAAETGGGLSNDGTLTLINSTVEGNDAEGDAAFNVGVSGGLYNDQSGTATIVRSTISGNRALGSDMAAGGIFTFGTVNLRSTTVTRNAGPFREIGGIMAWSPGVATVANSIIAGNETEDGPGDCTSVNGGVITSLGHNLWGGVACDPGPTEVIVDAAQVATQVLEPDLEDNGGPTRTHALITRGRAVDAGYCPGETADQRGFPVPVDDPAMPNALDACDIGAYELQGPVALVADLMISQTVDKTSVKQGELLTYSIRVQNLGPETAPNVVVTDILPSGATFVEARHNKGTHTAPPRGETGTLTWSVGEMLDQANEVAQITVTVLVKGKTTITNTASVTGDVSDPNTANNTAAIKVSVAAGSAGKPGGARN